MARKNVKTLRSNYGWSGKEIDRLFELKKSGLSETAIGLDLDRSPKAIKMKLGKLRRAMQGAGVIVTQDKSPYDLDADFIESINDPFNPELFRAPEPDVIMSIKKPKNTNRPTKYKVKKKPYSFIMSKETALSVIVCVASVTGINLAVGVIGWYIGTAF